MPRIILFTGKGGVGKTTIASATAFLASDLGYKTLVISSDPAHSLSDAFEVELGYKPTKIEEKLYGMEVNVQKELEEHWDTIKRYLALFFKSQGIDDVLAEELAIFPGFDELASLLHLIEFYEKSDFDLIVLDCAPTGETLRLLSVPEVAKWYMNRFFGIEKKLLKIVRPIAEPIIDVPLPDDNVLDKVQELYIKIGKVKSVLESEDTTIRIVMNPEKMVIKESERAFTYLNLFGYRVDAVIVNKLFPERNEEFVKNWRKIQERYMEEIKEKFDLPILKAYYREREVVGKDLLEFAREIYGEKDPTEVFAKEKPMKIYSEDGYMVLAVKVPFAKKEELKLLKRGEELIILLGQWKRYIYLPQSLAYREVSKAKLEGGELKVYFS
ncbi:arsenite-activated ATPase ArsA [Ferroglobus placidus DSM 10642]|uniref:Putative arsenical pump-driving ATPase n=1 Tax=Ferroglobus placidus (strain DSM 10642 / AEDII12DO) TaxID=589924 RepID=D3S1X2_FERPA|nr:ArsA family ATPase [Ferroglobus placidus]ADC64429.1 arsenite-activated ATPase ArsA [Ferroglobus placidus DSM 10642]